MIKRIFSIFLSVLIMISALSSFSLYANAQSYSESLLAKGFDETYVSGLSALHDKYPNWNFEPFFTGVSWADAVAGERSKHSKQVIQLQSSLSNDFYCNCSSCYKNGSYVIREGSSWVAASQYAVEYYMDPRNWFDEKHIFQFLAITYDSSQTQSGVESVISSTWMKNANITYKNTYGQDVTYGDSNGNTVKYSKAILDGAMNSGVSAYYLASKIVQEVGGKTPTAGGACGTKAPFNGIYNYYNIGANTGAMDGLEWASGFLKTKSDTTIFADYDPVNKTGTGKTTKVKADQYMSYIDTFGDYYRVRLYTSDSGSYKSGAEGYIPISVLRTTYFNYGRPWTDPYKTIYNGASYIANSFLRYQYTGYLQKFNVNPESSNMFDHEYMANVQGAAMEAETTYKAYSNAGILSSPKTFYIPVFASMTEPVYREQPVVKALEITSRKKDSLSFRWAAIQGASKYYLSVKNLTNGNSFSKTVTTSSATINGLNAGNEYLVKIKAYIGGSWADYSVGFLMHTTPPKVKNLKVTKTTTSSVSLKWNKISGVTGYIVYKYTPNDKKYTELMLVEGCDNNSAKVTSLTSGKKYEFAVLAYVSDASVKKGAKSDIVKSATKPEKVNIKRSVYSSKSAIKTSWKAINGSATGFQIEYARDKKFKKKIATKTFAGKAKTSYIGKGFTKGKACYVRVRAYVTVGSKKHYGSWSSVVKVK